jgi:hypothetical protein
MTSSETRGEGNKDKIHLALRCEKKDFLAARATNVGPWPSVGKDHLHLCLADFIGTDNLHLTLLSEVLPLSEDCRYSFIKDTNLKQDSYNTINTIPFYWSQH